jgi:probable F420-dependent oxidoreductase
VGGPLQVADTVKCGVVVAGGSRDSTLDSAQRAERLGYDSIWVGDHLSFHIPILESLTLLSFLAAATERVTLGTAVYLAPLRPPVAIAKITSTLDVLSAGRLTLGIGVGGEFPPEFEGVGVPVAERGSRTDETIEILRRLWSEDAVVHEGRHFRFGPLSIDPKPSRRSGSRGEPGGPPIWVGGRRPPAFRRAGRLGNGYISHMTAPETYRRNFETMQTHAAEAGREEQEFGTAAFLFTVIDDRYEAALDRAVSALENMYRVPFRDAAPRYCLLGRPEDCVEQMARFTAAGCRHFILAPLSEGAATVEAFGGDALAQVRGLL